MGKIANLRLGGGVCRKVATNMSMGGIIGTLTRTIGTMGTLGTIGTLEGGLVHAKALAQSWGFRAKSLDDDVPTMGMRMRFSCEREKGMERRCGPHLWPMGCS